MNCLGDRFLDGRQRGWYGSGRGGLVRQEFRFRGNNGGVANGLYRNTEINRHAAMERIGKRLRRCGWLKEGKRGALVGAGQLSFARVLAERLRDATAGVVFEVMSKEE